MACFHPLEAWQKDSGEITFTERGQIRRALTLPCGRCIGCRLAKAQTWAIRSMHEAQMHEQNSFVTLTYNETHVDPSLNYSDFQTFMRRLRKARGKIRFFMCGEYGSLNLRPHFHALLFGTQFKNDGQVSASAWRSQELEKLWPAGYSSAGELTMQSAGYVARYTVKKITGDRAQQHYARLHLETGELVQATPEFGHMSLKPGIGATWFAKYWRDIYIARDGVPQPGGRTLKPPRYYDELLNQLDHGLKEEKDYDRYIRSQQFANDCTPDRLAVREKCAAAKAAFLRRDL